SEEARYDHRLHGVLLVAQGMNAPEVARLLGDGVRTVEYWIERFNQNGFAGLVEGERPGRPSKLTVEQLQELELILRVPPRAQSISANLWDGKTLSHWVKEHWGVELSTRQCQRLFRQLFGVGCAERKNAAPHVHLGFAVRMCTEMAKALERSGTTG